ncbi:CDP-glycerol glycerophosphotransferase family protein [Candidatus Wolfebacteria bacterium]|nr:CDP-glycerol glycerophosphotransferase family protein [Candidatus Wolfebacteria bacterium]
MLSKLITFLVLVTARPLFWLSHLMPRNLRLWVFVGWHGKEGKEVFADNTKYLFLHTAHKHPNIKAVWLARDGNLAEELRKRGYRSYYHQSFRGIWCALRAGMTCIDAYLQPKNFRWSGRTILVQLLHGKGMKKGGYAAAPPRRYDYIFCPSPFVRDMLPQQFVGSASVVVTGYPRNDVLFGDVPGSELHVSLSTKTLLADHRFARRILYAPTFRRGEEGIGLEKLLDLERMSRWLVRHDYLLVLSLHPKYTDQARGIASDNIHFLEDSDIYPLLPAFDALITDYSSLFSDFLLFDRPIVFYSYDLEEYSIKEGLTHSYDLITPGEKVRTSRTLIDALDRALVNNTWKAERERVRELYHTHIDGDASKRITDTLLLDKRIMKTALQG